MTRHKTELLALLQDKRIDVALISETHLTSQSRITIPNYNIYRTDHPDDTAHGGAAIIIKRTLKQHIHSQTQFNHMQATAVTVQCKLVKLTLASVYCPPRFRIDSLMFSEFFTGLGPNFIAGGDYNAKHPLWGSRLITPRGRQLHTSLLNHHLDYISPTTPTYWPTDPNRQPDLLDFFICRGIRHINKSTDTLLDLSSDHSPVLLTLDIAKEFEHTRPTLTPGRTDWEQFRELISDSLNLKLPLKTEDEIEYAIDMFTDNIQQAAWSSSYPRRTTYRHDLPLHIRRLIQIKRRWRGRWQRNRLPSVKRKFNQINNELKRAIFSHKCENYSRYTENLNESDGSLWRATRRVLGHHQVKTPLQRGDGTWARTDCERAALLAEHFSKVFQPHTDLTDNAHEHFIQDYLSSPLQISPPPKAFTPGEVESIINKLPNKKAPGYDLITSEVLKQLPRKAILFLTNICNSILRTTIYPSQWKISVLMLFPKPNKPPNRPDSYRPISLLPLCSKVFEKLLLQRIAPIIEESNVIPPYQFGFRSEHSTIQQLHRVVDFIASGLERKHYTSGALLDVKQAFDRVWHNGLLFKLKQILPFTYFLIFKSFLTSRYFVVNINNYFSKMYPIKAGVPQGSVLSPLLYNIYTGDMPTTDHTLSATYADDTAILSSSESPIDASLNLQNHLTELSTWLQKWKMKVNPVKSSHITFTLRPQTCPPVYINNTPIPQTDTVKYLGVTLDRRLTWKSHILLKRQTLTQRTKYLYSLIGKHSSLPLSKKLSLYNYYLKPIWTYGCQIYGTSKPSNISRLQSAQSKILRLITNSPWYVQNETIHNDLKVPYVQDYIKLFYQRFHRKLARHKNELVRQISGPHIPDDPPRRLKRVWNRDLLQP